ncbi:toll-like receptor 13 [Bufo bufo]|uniref:toll-like receptor 13 n=1 Tax=Bufo bufo TaxID=8384 RepID=UPI001ABDD254|nr:toll-like receptor 13 [Bufo bufo]
MNYYCTSKQIILLLILVQIATSISAFGYAKCFLAYENSQYANCIGQRIVNLTQAIQHLPNKTQWLNASQNYIVRVERKSFFHLPNLLGVQLNRNQISTVQSGAFQNLKYLHWLDLSYNSIKSLDNWDISDLTDLRILNIGHNNINTIQIVSLTPLHHLQELDLSYNYITNFATVAEAVNNLAELSTLNLSSNLVTNLSNAQRLITLQSLKILDLSSNAIGVLDLSYFYMPNLSGLMVMKNNMGAINASSFLNVPKLAKINFDENPLNISFLLGIQLPNLTELHWSSMRPNLDNKLTIPCQVFKSLPKLQVLYIMRSKVSHSNIGKIGECTNLTTLVLSTSSFRNLIKRDLQMFKYIKVLYLNKCKINTIWNTTWIGLKFLHTLILERNNILYLQDRLFSPLTGLQYLDLSKNSLTYINSRSFEDLNKLKTLILRSCKIATIKPFTFKNLRNLSFLDIRDNSISRIRGKSFDHLKRLETLLLSENKIQSVQGNGLQELVLLKKLTLANNNIYKVSNTTFHSLKTLKILNISGNALSFNKRDSVSPFQRLKYLESLDISYQRRRYKDPVSEALFQGLRSLKQLYIQGIPSSFFKDVSFSFLPNLTEIDMTGTFQGADLYSMVELIRKCNQIRYLCLDNNEITNIPVDTFVGFNLLENLSLKYNKLKNISEHLVKPLSNLRNFDLFMNPLLCSCENYWFQNWSKFDPQVQIPFLESYICFGQVTHEISFVNQDLSFCGTDISLFFFIASFVLTLLLLVASLVTVKLKWSLLYFYHMMQVWLRWRIKKGKKLYEYDAYISYCSEDEDWVIKELLFHLESKGQRKYKLCFKSRDFIPGSYHIDNIQESIKNSRKTLCVVSRNYLESQWCKVEVEIACSRVFYEKEDVLLVVFLEEIPNFRLSAYHKLRKLIKQNTYINWPEDPKGNEFFWFKLRKALDAGVYETDTMQLSVTN